MEQTFALSTDRRDTAGEARMSAGTMNEDLGGGGGEVMWGYSPNFMMKQQQRSRSLEGGADQFSKLTVEDENSERENR